MRVLVVKFQIKPEYRQHFLEAALEDARGANQDEPGCLRFDVIQDEADPNRIYFYEVYTDDDAFQAHLEAPHYIQWRDAVREDWYATPAEVGRGWNLYPPDAEWR